MTTTELTTDQMLHELAAVVSELKNTVKHDLCSGRSCAPHFREDSYLNCEGRGYILPPLDSRGEPSEAFSIVLQWACYVGLFSINFIFSHGAMPGSPRIEVERAAIPAKNREWGSEFSINPSAPLSTQVIHATYKAALVAGLIGGSDDHWRIQ